MKPLRINLDGWVAKTFIKRYNADARGENSWWNDKEYFEMHFPDRCSYYGRILGVIGIQFIVFIAGLFFSILLSGPIFSAIMWMLGYGFLPFWGEPELHTMALVLWGVIFAIAAIVGLALAKQKYSGTLNKVMPAKVNDVAAGVADFFEWLKNKTCKKTEFYRD